MQKNKKGTTKQKLKVRGQKIDQWCGREAEGVERNQSGKPKRPSKREKKTAKELVHDSKRKGKKRKRMGGGKKGP